MFAKKTSKNQIALPKAVAVLFLDATYFDISAEEGRIVLVPVRPDHANKVRAKLADLGIDESDVADAIDWARSVGGAGGIHGVHRNIPGLCGTDPLATEMDNQCRSSQVEIADAKRRKSSRCLSQIACTIAQLTFS